MAHTTTALSLRRRLATGITWFAAGKLALFAIAGEPGAGPAPSTKPVQAPRAYTGRVEWHAAPVEAEMPHRVEEATRVPSDMLDVGGQKPLDYGVQPGMAPAYLYQHPVRRQDREETRKQRNWLVLSVEERKAAESARGKKPLSESSKAEDMGWGWLATSVMQQREKAQAEEEAQDEAEKEIQEIAPLLPTEALIRSAQDKPSGLIVSPVYDEGSAYAAARVKPMMLDAQEQQNMQRVAIDDENTRSLRGDYAGGQRLVSTRQSDSGIAQPLANLAAAPLFSGDALKKDSLASPANVLPQTAALLSPRHGSQVAPSSQARPQPAPLFQIEKPASTFDLSMPSARVSDSSILPPAFGAGSGVDDSGFFTPPRNDEIRLRPARSASGRLLMPTPSPSISPTEQPAATTPLFPTSPSWRK